MANQEENNKRMYICGECGCRWDYETLANKCPGTRFHKDIARIFDDYPICNICDSHLADDGTCLFEDYHAMIQNSAIFQRVQEGNIVVSITNNPENPEDSKEELEEEVEETEEEDDYWNQISDSLLESQPDNVILNENGDHSIECYCERCVRGDAIARIFFLIAGCAIIFLLFVGLH
jgi:hypothetical protein